MKRLATIAREAIGLFVDDVPLAAAAAAWLLLAVVAMSRIAGHRVWDGPVLFVGLAAVLVVTTIRRTGRRG